jgi:hypothetical protein
MANNRDSQTENELERIGRIRTLRSLEKGDQLTIYFNNALSNVEPHVEKFDRSFKETAKLILSAMEVERLIKILEKSIDHSSNK